MATRRQIKCINKTNRFSTHDRIQYIGGDWGKVTQPEGIRLTENGTYQYYVKVGLTEIDVIVAIHNGNKYLKTKNDGLEPNNLLSLPECP
jgi:hypothetical protein